MFFMFIFISYILLLLYIYIYHYYSSMEKKKSLYSYIFTLTLFLTNMKMSCWRMLLFLLGYILYFYRFVDAEILQTFSDFEIEEQLKVVNKPATKIIKVPLLFILNSRAILFTSNCTYKLIHVLIQ